MFFSAHVKFVTCKTPQNIVDLVAAAAVGSHVHGANPGGYQDPKALDNRCSLCNDLLTIFKSNGSF